MTLLFISRPPIDIELIASAYCWSIVRARLLRERARWRWRCLLRASRQKNASSVSAHEYDSDAIWRGESTYDVTFYETIERHVMSPPMKLIYRAMMAHIVCRLLRRPPVYLLALPLIAMPTTSAEISVLFIKICLTLELALVMLFRYAALKRHARERTAATPRLRRHRTPSASSAATAHRMSSR